MELVVEDGVFVTMAADGRSAGSVLIRDGRIAAVGQPDEVRAAAPGAAVVPGQIPGIQVLATVLGGAPVYQSGNIFPGR